MKTKYFVASTHKYNKSKKTTDYWGMLFVGFIFLSSMSCFLFANHSDRQATNNLSDSSHTYIPTIHTYIPTISVTITDPDQSKIS